MPRILSRHTGVYRRGPSVVKTNSARYGMGTGTTPTTAQSSSFTSYFTFLSDHLPSTVSSTASSRRSLNSAHNSESRCSPPTSASSRPSWSPNAVRGSATDEEGDGNVWGHHIDPAEAEAEITRHSRILSQRAAAVMMY